MYKRFTKVAIVGTGMVGGAVLRYFQKKEGLEIFTYDKGKNLGSPEEGNKGEIVFVCVPTPYLKDGKGFDLSYVEETMEWLEGEKVVVIKSTVLPGTTEMLQRKYPQHKLLINPEFLTEETADQDMCYPDRQIVGYTPKSHGLAGDVIQLLPLAPFERILPATEAELVKYFGNTWFSVKVSFANTFYDLCQKLGIDYDRMVEAAAADKRIGRTHLNIWHKGYRGYGGKCLAGEEVVYEVTGNSNSLKVVPVRDFQGRKILSMKDDKIIVDEVLAKSQRKIKETIKFYFSKGRTLETSPDHLMVIFDKNKGLVQKRARDMGLNDKIPVIMGRFPLIEKNISVDFFENCNTKEEVFIGQVDTSYFEALKPFLTPNQYHHFRRGYQTSLPLRAVLDADISLPGSKIKTRRRGNWIPRSLLLDKDFARLIGYYLSEGCINGRRSTCGERICFTLGYHEKELIEDLISILHKFDIKFNKGIHYRNKHASVQVINIFSQILSEYFGTFFGKNCTSKRIPSYMFSASQEIKDQLLTGLFRGDGSIGKYNLRGNYYKISYATVSRNLIEGIDLLLREKGILASRRVQNLDGRRKPCYVVEITEPNNVREILPFFTPERRKDIEISSIPQSPSVYTKVNENIVLLNVRRIEVLKNPKLVYALETKTNYYLTSGGVLTHNCLPKDIKAFIQLADSKGVDLKLHKTAELINEELMRQQGIEDPEKKGVRKQF